MRRHHVETVGGARGEPFFDGVGDLLGGAGEHAVAARSRETMQEPADRRTFLGDDLGDHLLAAAGVVGDIACLPERVQRDRGVEIEGGQVDVGQATDLLEAVGGYGQLVELAFQFPLPPFRCRR